MRRGGSGLRPLHHDRRDGRAHRRVRAGGVSRVALDGPAPVRGRRSRGDGGRRRRRRRRRGVPGPLGSASRLARPRCPARLAAIAGAGAADAGASRGARGNEDYVADLFQLYTGVCGSCHGAVQGLGGFDIVTQQQFESLMTADVLKHVTSNGPSDRANPWTRPTRSSRCRRFTARRARPSRPPRHRPRQGFPRRSPSSGWR